MLEVLKRVFVGRPLATTQMEEQRLTEDDRARGLLVRRAVVDRVRDRGDPLRRRGRRRRASRSGSASSCRSRSSSPALLAIVIVSYRQVIFAYPSGGGAYVVSKENIGEMASLVAGASLMVDYVLTVAVSISAGVAAIISIPEFSGLADASRRARRRCSSCSSR